jgi:hypothetical protein
MARAPFPDCKDGQEYRFVAPGAAGTIADIPAGVAVPFRAGNGQLVQYTTPQQVLELPSCELTGVLCAGGVLVANTAPKFGWSPDLLIHFTVPEPESNIDDLKSAVLAIAPTASIHVAQRNMSAMESYRAHHGAITLGVQVGFALAMLAFAIAVTDRAVERRRDVVMLVVLGMRNRSIRVVQFLQLMVPLWAALGVAVLVGDLGGNAWLRLNGRIDEWYGGTVTQMWPLVTTAIAVTAISTLIVAGRRVRAEDLRRE